MQELRREYIRTKSSLELITYNDEHISKSKDIFQSAIKQIIYYFNHNYLFNSKEVQQEIENLKWGVICPFVQPESMLNWFLLAFDSYNRSYGNISFLKEMVPFSFLCKAIEYYISKNNVLNHELDLIKTLEQIVLSRKEYLITSSFVQSLVSDTEAFYKIHKDRYCFSVDVLMRRLVYIYGEPAFCTVVDYLYGEGSAQFLADAIIIYRHNRCKYQDKASE